MNLPNQLTLLRILLIPVLIVLYLMKNLIGEITLPIIGVIFIIASFTDFLDGYIARKRNIVTTFGKFIDPLADKLLVITTMLLLTDYYLTVQPSMWMPIYAVLIVIARELIVTSIRLVAVGEGNIIAASTLGKAKTAITMIMIVYYLFLMPLNFVVLNIIGYVLVGFALLLTLISGFDYYWKNRFAILQTK